MKSALIVVQIIISALLALVILVQQRGSGLGSLAGGSGNDGFHAERRGAEKMLYSLTIFLGVAFCVNALAVSFLSE